MFADKVKICRVEYVEILVMNILDQEKAKEVNEQQTRRGKGMGIDVKTLTAAQYTHCEQIK